MQVGPRPVWKSSDHPLRKDLSLQLSGIPTLVRWSAKGPEERLAGELEIARTPEEADCLIANYVAKGRVAAEAPALAM